MTVFLHNQRQHNYLSTLADNTWAEIAAASAEGKAADLWSVGDTKDIVVLGETLTLAIYGFNHDNLTSGGKAGITFGLKNLMRDTRQMNRTPTNKGGITGSELYVWLQSTVYNALPSDLKSLIKPINKITSIGGGSTTLNTSSMKLFLFSEYECSGTTFKSAAGEGTKYPIFTGNESRIKKIANGTGSANDWWFRSPTKDIVVSFCCASYSGPCSYTRAEYTTVGVCFGFCI